MNQKLDILKRKEEIRKETIRQLREQDPSLREERSRKVQEELLSSREYQDSKVVMAYVSLPTEVDTHYFIKKTLERGKKLAVPYIDTADESIIASELTSIDDLVKGPFGIYEPEDGPAKAIPLEKIELIVVPGIAFDRRNMRLGRGKGYYDKFLADEKISSSKTIGLAFKFQVIDSLPSDPHDMPVSRVITD
ncbi:MAG: 5-formyltetrahydrofolate cyclo-ligase [Candidatus Omnitrophota bacterium]